MDDDDDLEGGYGGVRRRRRPRGTKPNYPPIPSEAGSKLMQSGTFGSNEYYQDMLKKRNKKVPRRLLARELGLESAHFKRPNGLISQVITPFSTVTSFDTNLFFFQSLIPSSNADTIIHYNARCYSGQFSDDGNFFFSCAQDFKVRMYDTSNPYRWKYYKTVDYHYGQWTITDASLSPDNRYLAYSSIRSTVCLAATDPDDRSEPSHLDFTNTGGRSNARYGGGYSHFGVCGRFSVHFCGNKV